MEGMGAAQNERRLDEELNDDAREIFLRAALRGHKQAKGDEKERLTGDGKKADAESERLPQDISELQREHPDSQHVGVETAEAVDRERQGTPTGPDNYDDEEKFVKSPERRVFARGWFLALLGGLAILGVAVVALPYLGDWMSFSAARSPTLEPAPSVPLKPPPVSPTQSEAASASPGPLANPIPRPSGPPLPPPTSDGSPSAAAAAKVPVKAKLGPEELPTTKMGAVLPNGEFWVQVGAFMNSEYAARLATQVTAEHYPVVIGVRESAAAPYVVWVGKYPRWERAKAVRAGLETKGFRGFIVKDQRP